MGAPEVSDMRVFARLAVLGQLLWFGQCRQFQEAVSTTPDEFLTLTAAASSIPADGASTVVVTARLSNAAGPDLRQVTFEASAGTVVGRVCDTTTGLCPNSIVVTADVQGFASMVLRAPTEMGSAVVEARLGDTYHVDLNGVVDPTVIIPGPVGRTLDIGFTRAWPQRVEVGLENIDDRGDTYADQSVEPCSKDQVIVKANVSRERGQVTEGTQVEFGAVIEGRGAFGSFHSVTPTRLIYDNTSSEPTLIGNQASAVFTPGDPDSGYRGPVLIRARVHVADEGYYLEGATYLYVIEPGLAVDSPCP